MLFRALKLFSKVDASAFIFILGVGSFFLADALIASNGTDQEISDWALLRSFMMISSACALFGMEQLVFREPKAAPIIFKVSRVHLVSTAMIAGFLGVWLNYVSGFWIGFIVVIGFACSSLTFQWFRSILSITKAYVAYCSWRLFFFIGIAVFFIHDYSDINTIIIGAFMLSAIIILYLLATSKVRTDLVAIHSDIKTSHDVYAIGALYFMSSLSLAIASFGESLVIHSMGNVIDVALYLKAALVFLFPGVIINQYLAARLGPLIRQEESKTLGFIKAHFWKGLIGLIILFGILFGFGCIFEFLLYGEKIVPLELAILLSITSCIRLAYLLPSGFIGVVANRKQLMVTTIGYLVCALLLPLLSVMFHAIGFSVVMAVAIANLCNWVVRSLIGVKLIISRYKQLDIGQFS